MPIDVSKIAKLGKKAAQEILERLAPTAEKAVALKGEERAAYLAALDTLHGPAKQRAADLGFSKDTFYHGTSVPIEQFKDEAKGLSTGAQSAKRGYFFASDPSTASDYANLAHEKGVIREGDKVTTRYLSDTAELHNDAYDKAKDLAFEQNERAQRIGRQRERNANTKSILDDELANPRFPERIPDLQKKLSDGENLIKQWSTEKDEFGKQIRAIDDTIGSGGQNVLPVKLRGDNNVHVKDYKDQGYRDTTYADEMSKAKDAGKSGVLFKNTYDAADPNNKIKQNIAAVFEPNQIRSTNAAFDPRFKDSPLLLAAKTAGDDSALVRQGTESLRKQKAAQEIVQRLAPDAETAVALKGPERAQYLEALDALHGSREQRATDAGFGPTMYHGTDHGGIKQFKKDELGTFLTPKPEFADSFNENLYNPQRGDIYPDSANASGMTYPVRSRANKLMDPADSAQVSGLQQLLHAKGQLPERIIDARAEKLHKGGADDWQTLEDRHTQEAIKELGHDGYMPTENGVKNTAVYDPAMLRSTNAAFDPRFRDSSLLLAANTPGASNPIAKQIAAALSASDMRKVQDYSTRTASDQRRNDILAMQKTDEPIQQEWINQMVGKGKFKDTGRASSGAGEALDSLAGVPMRTGIAEIQKNITDGEKSPTGFDIASKVTENPYLGTALAAGIDLAQYGLAGVRGPLGNYYGLDTAKKIAQSIGTDPQKAPSGFDIASKVTENPYLGTALATGIDLAQLPIPGMAGSKAVGGIEGSIAKVRAARAADDVMMHIKSRPALDTALEKLNKAAAAGEPVGFQTGVDINSQKALKAKLGTE